MIKATYDLVYETLKEKRDNLLKYKNIYSFADFKLPDNVVSESIQDIDNFLNDYKSLKDPYIVVHNSADFPENPEGIDVLKLRLLDHTFGNVSVYFVIIAIEAQRLNVVDLCNRQIFEQSGKYFFVESKYNQLKKGSLKIKKAVFNEWI